MHLIEEHRKKAEKNHLNVIVAGLISSDNFGLILLMGELLKGTQIPILACSGFQRVVRSQ